MELKNDPNLNFERLSLLQTMNVQTCPNCPKVDQSDRPTITASPIAALLSWLKTARTELTKTKSCTYKDQDQDVESSKQEQTHQSVKLQEVDLNKTNKTLEFRKILDFV